MEDVRTDEIMEPRQETDDGNKKKVTKEEFINGVLSDRRMKLIDEFVAACGGEDA